MKVGQEAGVWDRMRDQAVEKEGRQRSPEWSREGMRGCVK